MKKTWTLILALVMLLTMAASGVCESLFVDNRALMIASQPVSALTCAIVFLPVLM